MFDYIYTNHQLPIMKKLTIVAVLVSLMRVATAQQVLFKENFTHMPGLNLSNGWTNVSSAAVGWRTSDFYDLYCSYSVIPQYVFFERVAAISGCYGDRLPMPRNNSNVLAYTKSINLQGITDGAVLKFDSYFNGLLAYGKYEKATIEVSTNDGASWTVVQNVPAGKPDSMNTWYVNLSQYTGNSNVRIGFRYSDQNVDNKLGGWAIDNIELYRPAKFDLALESFSPTNNLTSYVQVNNTISHYGKVVNKGLDTIKTFIVNYKRNNSYILSDTISAVVPPLTEYSFIHTIPDTVFNTGSTKITAWVQTAGDANRNNDTVYTTVNGAHFLPKKLVAVEEGTGTINEYGPRGLEYMAVLGSDYNACLVSIHSGDPMELEDYSDYLYDLKYYSGQFFLLDRQYVEPTELFAQFHRYNTHFGYADLELHGGVFGNTIDVGVRVKPAVDMQGDFRLILVITESGVNKDTAGYEQENGYANNSKGPMGGYENKPNPVPAKDVTYHNVARYVSPSADGGQTFATELKYNGSYFHKFNVQMQEGWDKNRLQAIVMLYDYNDTLILNSNKLNYFLSVADNSVEEIKAGIYPNPATNFTSVEFEAETNSSALINIINMNGALVKRIPIEQTQIGKNKLKIDTQHLPTGIYIVNIKTDSDHYILKLQVVR